MDFEEFPEETIEEQYPTTEGQPSSKPEPEIDPLEGRLICELTSFELAAANPKKENDFVDAMKLLGKKAYHGSSMGHPFRGADSAPIMESIYYDLPVVVMGTRPFHFTRSHNLYQRVFDGVEHIIDNIGSNSPISIERAIKNFIYELAVYPPFERDAAIQFIYSKMYPEAVREFRTFEEADAYRKKYDDGSPISIVFSELLEMAPGPAAYQATKDGYHLSLDLLEIRKGIPVSIARSRPNTPTKQLFYDWKDTIDATQEKAAILRVKADLDKVERHKREITHTASGQDTTLNEMLNYISQNTSRPFSGLFVVEIEPLNRQWTNIKTDLMVVFQMSKHLQYIFAKDQMPHKPVGPKIVR